MLLTKHHVQSEIYMIETNYMFIEKLCVKCQMRFTKCIQGNPFQVNQHASGLTNIACRVWASISNYIIS